MPPAELKFASNADPFMNAENIQPNSNARAGPNSSNAAVQRRTAGDSIFSAEPAGIGGPFHASTCTES